MTTAQAPSIIAVSVTEFREFGCPYCGFNSGSVPVSGQGAAAFICGDDENCGKNCVVLADDLTISPMGVGGVYPEVQPHPRRGTPSHGREDKRPEGGGEFFSPRGIGLDTTPGCFVCGGPQAMLNNIAAFVRTKTAGERVVAMFEKGAWLDYRPSEPDWVQVKIGACDPHLPKLERLMALAREKKIITAEMIEQSLA